VVSHRPDTVRAVDRVIHIGQDTVSLLPAAAPAA
jgi:hypothetical protein